MHRALAALGLLIALLLPGCAPESLAVMHPELVALTRAHSGFSGYSPVTYRKAYALPGPPAGAGQVVAVVDAFDAPTIEQDLGVFDQADGLPACTRANGCLTVVNQDGGSDLPAANPDWATETSLDVETVHGICPACKILLVEASDASGGLDAAVATAIRMGADEVSLSWGGAQSPFQHAKIYEHAGVAIVAGSSDSGYGGGFPASNPKVVSVGGTSLVTTASGFYGYETAWKGTGSGCSAYGKARVWQRRLGHWLQTGCGAQRAMNDVAAVADPYTGEAVYDSTPNTYKGRTLVGWNIWGGVSLAAPIIAATFALAGGVAPNVYAPSVLYRHKHKLHDVRGGSNGACSAARMCNAVKGFDGPTGLGSPNGIADFKSQ